MIRIIEKTIEPSKIYERQVFKIKLKIVEDKNIINYVGDYYTNNVNANLPTYAE